MELSHFSHHLGMQCSNNVKQIALAFHNYESATKSLPINYAMRGKNGFPNNGPGIANSGRSWMQMILPYIEQTPLYNNIDFTVGLQPKTSAPTTPVGRNRIVAATVISTRLIHEKIFQKREPTRDFQRLIGI